jgi:hypothetical protein
MSNIRDFGEALGRAIAAKTGAPVELPAPVNAVTVTVDTAPIADAMAGISAHVVQPVDLSGVVSAIADMPATNLDGVERAISAMSAALGDDGVALALEMISANIRANTQAVMANTEAIHEQTAVLKMDKTVTYDEQGRVTRVKTV